MTSAGGEGGVRAADPMRSCGSLTSGSPKDRHSHAMMRSRSIPPIWRDAHHRGQRRDRCAHRLGPRNPAVRPSGTDAVPMTTGPVPERPGPPPAVRRRRPPRGCMRGCRRYAPERDRRLVLGNVPELGRWLRRSRPGWPGGWREDVSSPVPRAVVILDAHHESPSRGSSQQPGRQRGAEVPQVEGRGGGRSESPRCRGWLRRGMGRGKIGHERQCRQKLL